MSKVRAKIPWKYRIILFSVILLLWCSGLLLYIFQEWMRGPDGFGPHYLTYQFRRVHAAASFMMMITYGYILASHVPASWKQNRQRIIGLVLLAAQLVMIITAYMIYYFGELENIINYIKKTHFIVGLLFPSMLIVHIIGSIVTKPKSSKKRKNRPSSSIVKINS